MHKYHLKEPYKGLNVKRFRKLLGIKQDALAYELSDDSKL
jgi:hypothetical protein